VKQALEELRIECPFRKSEGCMAELPWNTWDLRAHITEMRHGERGSRPKHLSKYRAHDLHEGVRELSARVSKVVRGLKNGRGK